MSAWLKLPKNTAESAAPRVPLPAAVLCEPLSPAGVARYADASLNRVSWLQVVVALIASLNLVAAVRACFFPTISASILELPEAGGLVFGRLNASTSSVIPLSENRKFGIFLDIEDQHRPATAHDLDIRLIRDGYYLSAPLGKIFVRYPKMWRFPFNRLETMAWWEAWNGILLAGLGFATFIGLLASWWLLATIYSPIAWLLGHMSRRNLTLSGAWYLCAAALVPGAILISGAIAFYALDWIGYFQLLGAYLLHLIVPWVYIPAALFYRPRLIQSNEIQKTAPSANPFGATPQLENEQEESRSGNPFSETRHNSSAANSDNKSKF